MTDNADAERLNESQVSRILRPSLLAPDIVVATLEGRTDQALMLEMERAPLAGWDERRQRFA